MQYKTIHKNMYLVIKPSLDPITREETYTIWQCGLTRKGLMPIAGWGGYANATTALADFKRKYSEN